jgi:DGQHR domain-containing protein
VPTFKYRGVVARQSKAHKAITIAAPASEVFAFTSIARAGRDERGTLHGFQRPQIAVHIREIRNYLKTPEAVLPNSIVVGFVEGVKVREISAGIVEITIDATGDPLGYVIDGQQRLTALAGLPEKEFELFVSVLVCKDVEELRRQFVLLNSTRPLPKALIYELLPGTSGLPDRLSSRSFAASLTERLNIDRESALRGKIYQYTNPKGVIRDTSIQKIIMHSVSDGAIRELPLKKQFSEGFTLVSEFFWAVRATFPEDWEGHTAKTSRLVHGAGIQALGFVMELLIGRDGACNRVQFAQGLRSLKGRTAWASGSWRFSDSEQVPWNKLENTHRQIVALAQYLVGIVRGDARRELQLEPPPAESVRDRRRARA